MNKKSIFLMLICSGIMLGISVSSCHQQAKETKINSENIPSAPTAVAWNSDSLTLDNGVVKRKISFSGGGEVFSDSYRLMADRSEADFLSARSLEFSMMINEKRYTGLSGWNVAGIEKAADATGGTGASIWLRPLDGSSDFEVKLTYFLYPGLSAVRKQLTVINTGEKPLKIEEVDIESLSLAHSHPVNSWIYRQYARYKHLGPYVGDCNDPLVIVHNQDLRRGIAVGN
jgi:alpha-galactosidase